MRWLGITVGYNAVESVVLSVGSIDKLSVGGAVVRSTGMSVSGAVDRQFWRPRLTLTR